MGLLLSVLVACVGVIELLYFYSNVKRNLTLRPIRGNLSTVREGYIGELHSLRKRIANDLEILKNDPNLNGDEEVNIQQSVPTLILNSHEDVEIEYNKKSFAGTDCTASNGFLVTEREDRCSSREASPSARQFTVQEEPQGLQRSECKTSLPEFFIQEQINSKTSSDHPRYVLKDQEEKSGSSIPLPTKFIVSENNENELDTLVFEDATSTFNEDESEFASPASQQLSYQNDQCNKRPLSPYPSLDLPQVPRNSICNELVDSVIIIDEVDEESRKSESVNITEISDCFKFDSVLHNGTTSSREASDCSKVVIVDATDSTSKLSSSSINEGRKLVSPNFNEEFFEKSELDRLGPEVESVTNHSNRLIPVQNGNVASNSEINEKEHFSKSPSSFEVVEEEILPENATYDENYLNNLDGVSKQRYIKRNYNSRKPMRTKNVSANCAEKPSCSNSEETSDAEGTTKILIDVARELRKVSQSVEVEDNLEVVSNSKSGEEKEPEPFWVNQ